MATYTFEIYQDTEGKWRWRARSKQNKNIVGSASQGFASKQSAERNAAINGFPKL